MPVSTETYGAGEAPPRAKRCKLCDESSHRTESGSSYWYIELDRDLVDTISAIYPEWFQKKTNNNNNNSGHPLTMAEGGGGGGGGGSPSSGPRESPPKAVIDTSPLHIDQNKESLKVKLMLRRPFDQLVAQGIMPPHKTPAAYHGQRRQLERAKTGDMLKAKIQQRPTRHELERRHILEADPNHVDPSLAERQRMLKKARLADQLNDQLSHRPGPLELIQKNILHTEEPIEQAVKTGQIPYKATSEGQLNRPQHPLSYVTPEEDSQSSEGDNVSPGPPPSLSDVLENAAKSAGIVVSLIPSGEGTVVVAASSGNVSAAPVLLNKDTSGEIVFAGSLIGHQVASPGGSSFAASPSSFASSGSSFASSGSSFVPTTSSFVPKSGGSSFANSSSFVPATNSSSFVSTTSGSSFASTANNSSFASSPSSSSFVSSTSTLSPLSSVASPVPSIVSQPPTPVAPPALTPRPLASPLPPHKSDAPGKEKNRKKSKSKSSAPKARTIKFHEYKGPPSAQKSPGNCLNAAGESSYDLLLQQQTLLLQFQLQLQHKYPQIILPAQKTNATSHNNNNNETSNSATLSESVNAARIAGRLEDMKVSDLKAELKRRSLPVSGSKPQLIERLKSFTGTTENPLQNGNSVAESLQNNNSNSDQSHNSPHNDTTSQDSADFSEQMEIGEPSSPMPENAEQHYQKLQQQLQESQQKTQEEIVKEQQRQIEELQRELTLSKLKLQEATNGSAPAKAQLVALQKHLQARQQHQQQQQLAALQMQQLQRLQQVRQSEEQQRLQQQQHVAFQNQKNATGSLILNGSDAALVLNLMQGKAKMLNGHVRANSLPNFVVEPPQKPQQSPEMKSEFIEEEPAEVTPKPPLFADSPKRTTKKNSVKSQMVDDVLEILISNGELPPSAAQDPTTPNSAGVKPTVEQPVFPTPPDPNSPEAALGLDPTELLDSLDTLDSMDFTQFVMELGDGNGCHTQSDSCAEQMPMDTDDWLESLCVDGANNNAPLARHEPDLISYDPLLGLAQDPFDPFNLDEFRSSHDLTASLSWGDKVDYAA